MPPARRVITLHILGVALLVVWTGCSGAPSRPSLPEPPVAPPAQPAPVVPVATLAITSAETTPLTLGHDRRFTAVLVDSAGTAKDVTATASWQSSNQAVATIADSGVVKTRGIGGVEIEATVNGVTGRVPLDVGPPELPVARLSVRTGTTINCAVAGSTQVTFDASRSTGYQLTYHMEFGDGQGASHAASVVESLVRRVQTQPAQLTVVDGLGRSSSTMTSYCTLDLRRPGSYTARALNGSTYTLRFTDSGASCGSNGCSRSWLSGRYQVARAEGTEEGSLSGEIWDIGGEPQLALYFDSDSNSHMGYTMSGRILRQSTASETGPIMNLTVGGGADKGQLLVYYTATR